MTSEHLHIPTRVVFGTDAIDDIGHLADGLGGRRALLVSDQGIADAGHVDRTARHLQAAGLVVTVHTGVHENPTTEDVDACVETARAADVDLLIGLGGGSSIDTARGCNFLLTNGGRMEDYWGRNKATRPMLPFIAVPTTTGTGSEMQSFALIAQVETHRKMACGDPKAASAIAILDPTLSRTQPHSVIVATGLDCIAHALESAVSTASTTFSRLFSRESWTRAAHAFPRLLSSQDDLAAHGEMLTAAAYAGTAIEHSMLGAAHALANPLTARFGITHGRAVGLMLPHVLRYNAQDAKARAEYAHLARLADPTLPATDDETAFESLVERINTLLLAAGLETSLADLGVPQDMTDALAADASEQWTGRFNPRDVGAPQLREIYLAACTA